jgi:hypothetical protein
MHSPILSSRLVLASMGADVMDALRSGDKALAGGMMGCEIPGDASFDNLPLARWAEKFAGMLQCGPG